MKRRDLIAGGLSTAAIVCLNRGAHAGNAQIDPDFPRLFNGLDFTGMKFILANGSKEPGDTFKVDTRLLICSGKPNGYWYTEKSYKNFILRFDYRYKRPDARDDEQKFLGNSGYLIYIQGDPKVWPRAIEVQGMNRDILKTFAISPFPAIKAKDDNEARLKARKPVGEWNSVEIISKDGALTSSLNGVKIAESEPAEFKEGPIGFQSEGAEIHWRRVRIKEM